MISAKPRLVVPYGLKTLLEGVSRAILKTNPPNITQFAAVYFKELTVFREGNNSLDIKDLVKQFHQIKVEKWSEGMAQEKKPECVKKPERTSTVSQEPKRVEKSTDTEEDNITALQFSNKTTQFPSVHAQLLSEPEDAPEVARAPSKPTAPENATPPSSPSPAAVSPELAYIPADPAQFAAQILGNVSSVHSDHSEILMVDVATSMPVFPEEMLSSEAAEDDVVATPVHSGEMAAVQLLSELSVHVDLGSKSKDRKAEPPMASSFPLQDEQETPAYDQAPQVPLQAAAGVTSTTHIASIYKDGPAIEGVTNVEQILEQTIIPFSDHVARHKGNEQSPPLSPILVVGKTASDVSEKSVGSANFVQSESAKYDSLVYVEADASATTVSSEISVHLEVDIFALAPGSAGQEDSWENRASQELEVKPALSGEAAKVVRSGASVRSSSGPQPPVPEGLNETEIEPEWEAAPKQGLTEPAIAASEAGQPPPYSNMWTLYCLTDMSQQSRPSPPPAPGPFPQATLYLPNSKDPQFLQHPPKVTSPTYVMMDNSKKSSAPPFILVGSNVQAAQHWKPVPGHAVSQSDALKRHTAVQVPTAVPADQKFQKHAPNPQNANPPTSGQDVPRPHSPVSVAFLVEDVAKKGSGFGDKRTPSGSYGIAGEVTVTIANVRRAET
ncbi:calcium-binding tyrosine phosphorylation-regulated protein isoform X1 [Physeter macrocephalus]|uniref:Calcium-binding tyrosine phosphorylation-regulated protein n=1 Tax=Physeter macrocephalus TaxID=9755 RepID=A0A2Y9SHF6_PHYMC|nr:calcium-binding tyrosine phosphorylation-regulated protein isoform X1 [Physeter catodon]XP_028336502.1 calcium-binding tyrosine phosphorylation-regulated protein isoform X1 [Physeter catodon]XP_028336503.1 calcium-binding tyrosine phosphorylation-regulated protein isoform X1 [Physeter catodon]XP_054936638.1 calcium-binding tyrosine phosphorylation-regulated protein isoform X1 [Physeter catodon]XP_054936639.1 calcium-binding tyrosine phosphorylation-regulated protein isoform X1 [Physeter cato|eukprot:XP_023976780.1 calcium-binding tyrosine phosphorylation-regulated protein isoform X1 [Physeter catodon]